MDCARVALSGTHVHYLQSFRLGWSDRPFFFSNGIDHPLLSAPLRCAATNCGGGVNSLRGRRAGGVEKPAPSPGDASFYCRRFHHVEALYSRLPKTPLVTASSNRFLGQPSRMLSAWPCSDPAGRRLTGIVSKRTSSRHVILVFALCRGRSGKSTGRENVRLSLRYTVLIRPGIMITEWNAPDFHERDTLHSFLFC